MNISNLTQNVLNEAHFIFESITSKLLNSIPSEDSTKRGQWEAVLKKAEEVFNGDRARVPWFFQKSFEDGSVTKAEKWLEAFERFLSYNIPKINKFSFFDKASSNVLSPMKVLYNLEGLVKAHIKDGKKNILVGDVDDAVNELHVCKDANYVWFDLGTNDSSNEKRSMGHCGGDPSASSIISLRKKIFLVDELVAWRPCVTASRHVDIKTLSQIKGRSNKKPAEKYHPFIKELFFEGIVTGFSKSNFLQEEDFNIHDFTEQEIKEYHIVQNTATFSERLSVLLNAEYYDERALESFVSQATEDDFMEYLDHIITSGNSVDNDIGIDYLLSCAEQFFGRDLVDYISSNEDYFSDHLEFLDKCRLNDVDFDNPEGLSLTLKAIRHGYEYSDLRFFFDNVSFLGVGEEGEGNLYSAFLEMGDLDSVYELMNEEFQMSTLNCEDIFGDLKWLNLISEVISSNLFQDVLSNYPVNDNPLATILIKNYPDSSIVEVLNGEYAILDFLDEPFHGTSALHVASSFCKLGAVKAVLDYMDSTGMSVDDEDSRHKTAIGCALSPSEGVDITHQVEIIDLLINAGIEPTEEEKVLIGSLKRSASQSNKGDMS